jgi:hypothetical protein
MAKSVFNEGISPSIALLQPSCPLRLCIGCGLRAEWRKDRKGRPFHFCGHCGIRIFIYNVTGLTGLELAHDLVMRSGPQRFQRAIQARVQRKLQGAAAR